MRLRAAVVALGCVLVLAVALMPRARAGQPAQVAPTVVEYLPLVRRPLPTNTPTNTPPATATPLPTALPTATPTQQPAGVFIVGSTFAYVDSISYLHVVGEVHNNTSAPLRFVKITANFFNANGQLLATDFTYILLDTLMPGVKTCFDVSLQQPAGWSSYQFEAVTYSIASSTPPNLAILNDSGSYDPSLKFYKIIGLIRNDEAVQVRFVQPVGTLYNAGGVPIGCGFTYVNSTDLSPGQTSAFSMNFSGRDWKDAATYRLQVDGTKQ